MTTTLNTLRRILFYFFNIIFFFCVSSYNKRSVTCSNKSALQSSLNGEPHLKSILPEHSQSPRASLMSAQFLWAAQRMKWNRAPALWCHWQALREILLFICPTAAAGALRLWLSWWRTGQPGDGGEEICLSLQVVVQKLFLVRIWPNSVFYAFYCDFQI